MNKPTNDFFNHEMAQKYDERNRPLQDISQCLHFLTTLTLKNVSPTAKVLCVGAGTGAEILALAEKFPQWSFVALEPSLSMLEVCRARLEKAGLNKRCEFVHGYTQDLPQDEGFDVVLSLLVSHFIQREDRQDYFQQMTLRLKKGGSLVNAEISYDLDSQEFPVMLKNWESVQELMGGTPESLAKLPQQLREVLTILPAKETEKLLRQSGVVDVVRFFQAFMISAWSAKKL